MAGDMNELLVKLSEAPENQADRFVTERCATMAKDGYTAADVTTLLDEIVHVSAASDFFVMALDIVWKDALEKEARS